MGGCVQSNIDHFGKVKLSNGDQIHYVQSNIDYLGKSPTLFFIHGMSDNSACWKRTMNHLANFKRHQIAIDLRGMGNSTYRNPTTRYGHWAEDVKQVCKLKGISKCVLVGWSFGGGVSMKVAEIAPDLVQKLFLVSSIPHSSIPIVSGERSFKTADEMEQFPDLKEFYGLIKAGSWENMMKYYEDNKMYEGLDFSQQEKEESAKAAMMQRNFLQATEACANSDIDINKIKAETLVLHGGQDFISPADQMKPTGDHFKNWILWEQNGHSIPYESSKEFQELLVKFVEGK